MNETELIAFLRERLRIDLSVQDNRLYVKLQLYNHITFKTETIDWDNVSLNSLTNEKS